MDWDEKVAKIREIQVTAGFTAISQNTAHSHSAYNISAPTDLCRINKGARYLEISNG